MRARIEAVTHGLAIDDRTRASEAIANSAGGVYSLELTPSRQMNGTFGERIAIAKQTHTYLKRQVTSL